MKCIYCQREIYYMDAQSFWVHVETRDEQCRPTFATPGEAETTCVCGHNRVFHAFTDDAVPCFASDCRCQDFQGETND
jgi:hypothetical protein